MDTTPTEENAPRPEGQSETHAQPGFRGPTSLHGEIDARELHTWQTAYQAAQPLETWLRLMEGQ